MPSDCTWAEARRYYPVILPALKSGIGAVPFVLPVSLCRVHIISYALTPPFMAVILVLQNFAGLLRIPSYALTPPFRAVMHETNRPGFSP